MIAGLTMLLAKLSAILIWVGQLFVKCWVAAWDIVRDAATWPFEQAMKIAVSAVNALPLDGIEGYAANAGNLPAEILNILGLLKVGTCIGIITAAIGIRIVLQLIPFTRLGS